MSGPRLFDLSPPAMGADWLVRLMRANGIIALHHKGGVLAEAILWGEASGTPPLPDHPQARFFTGLHSARLGAPVMSARSRVAFLRCHFRQAVFMNILRDADDWTAARLAEGGGRPARTEAILRGVTTGALPAIWRAEQAAHLTACRVFFKGDARYLELPYETLGTETLRTALAPWYSLTRAINPPAPRDLRTARSPDADLPLPAAAPARITPPLRGEDAAFAHRIAAFCLGQRSAGVDADAGAAAASTLYAHCDASGRVTRRNGQPWAIMRSPYLPGRPFLARPGQNKADRITGVLNEVLALGRTPALHLDMEDARRIGTGPDNAVDVPLLTYNRREGAQNLILWPLPGYHSPGAPLFVHPASPDPVPWTDKADRAVWRGDLSGQERLAGGAAGRSAHNLLREWEGLDIDDAAGEAAILTRLASVPRMAAVMRLAGNRDFDLRLTLSQLMADYAVLPLLAPHCGPRQPRGWFYRHRYILSMPGYDTGSNFLMAANSGSVVMKAMDGWQLYYSALFRPWQHFIPLAVDASDAEARLDWARSHPADCRAMVAASQAVCARLADTRLRRAALHLVLDGVAGW